MLWEADEPDHVETIEGFLDAKVRALLAHQSQHATTMRITGTGPASDEVEAFRVAVNDRAREAGSLAGITTGEAFKLIARL